VLHSTDELRVWSLGTLDDDEPALIQRLFDGIDKYTPQLVSWNGGGFDLPVLQQRAVIHGLRAARFWDLGDGQHPDSRDFKYNNYIGRFHTRHLDLMDVLALYNSRANAALDDMARLCGLPGKLGMDGGQVWQAFQAGELAAIRNYCETDVVNTYLLFLRFEKLRGRLNEATYETHAERLRRVLTSLPGAHWLEYLAAWR
jgi:hypothetical protein